MERTPELTILDPLIDERKTVIRRNWILAFIMGVILLAITAPDLAASARLPRSTPADHQIDGAAIEAALSDSMGNFKMCALTMTLAEPNSCHKMHVVRPTGQI